MINTDYPIKALDILLDVRCLPERYSPLPGYKNNLISALQGGGCKTKSDAEKLPDAFFIKAGICDDKIISLFRRFLIMYDPKPAKFKEIKNITSEQDKQKTFYELYHLPGVKQTRATLYYLAGYKTLKDFAEASPEEVLKKTTLLIKKEKLSFIAPLPKEVRTQIAVAKAFTMSE